MPDFRVPSAIPALRFALQRRSLAQNAGRAMGEPLQRGIMTGMAQSLRDRDEERARLEALKGPMVERARTLGDPETAFAIARAETMEDLESVPHLQHLYVAKTPEERMQGLRVDAMERTMPDEEGLTPAQRWRGEREDERATERFATEQMRQMYQEARAAAAERRHDEMMDWEKEKARREDEERARREFREYELLMMRELFNRTNQKYKAALTKQLEESMQRDEESRNALREAVQRLGFSTPEEFEVALKRGRLTASLTRGEDPGEQQIDDMWDRVKVLAQQTEEQRTTGDRQVDPDLLNQLSEARTALTEFLNERIGSRESGFELREVGVPTDRGDTSAPGWAIGGG